MCVRTLYIGVSIHTPTKGVTFLNAMQRYGFFLFQSTHPRRVWRNLHNVSHTIFVFQSTHPRRVWHSSLTRYLKAVKFQSTHPRRVWLSVSAFTCFFVSRFNPHTHEGCDLRLLDVYAKIEVSIHTPTKGVTQKITLFLAFFLFQSTHPRRVWQGNENYLLPWL